MPVPQARAGTPLRVLLFLLLGLCAALTSALSSQPNLMLALFTALAIPLALWMIVARQTQHTSNLEIGVVYAAAVAVYTAYPLLTFVAAGYTYTPFNDYRLFDLQPSVAQVSALAWDYVLYAAVFTAVYLLGRRRAGAVRARGMRVERSLVYAAVLSLVAAKSAEVALAAIYGRGGGDYYDEYLTFAAAPQLVQQLAGHLSGMILVLEIAVVILLVQRFDRFKWLLFAWLAAELIILTSRAGSRTELALLLMASVLAYSWMVRPIPATRLAVGSLAALGAFVVFGIIRSGGGLAAVAEGALFGSGEFEAIFGNAIDVLRLKAGGFIEGLFLPTYFGDFLSLVPQQLLPFAKANLSQWYVETFYFEAAQRGEGFAFGAIPESLVGNGVVDIVWRAAVLGLLFGRFHRYVAERADRFWVVTLYAWTTAFSFTCFRVSTFALLPRLVYQFGSAYMLVCVLMRLLCSASAAGSRNSMGHVQA